jgi:CheY-like chemotaxis protein
MGGQIGVESDPGKGSKFWFTATFEIQAAGVPANDAQAPLRGVKVLIVDSHATNRALVGACLSSWGCCWEQIADATSGLARLRQATLAGVPFQVVLLDVVPSSIEENAFVRQVGADPQLKGTALLAMIRLGQRSDWTSLEKAGFAAQVTKPVWKPGLSSALILALGRRQRPVPAVSVRRSLPPVCGPYRPRVLLAEDNLINREVARTMLNKLGCETDSVSNGIEAVNALQQTDYSAVLMDCTMPEMDGYQATRRIRNSGSGTRNQHVPIIAVTAGAVAGDRERCLRAGMNDYLAKPIELADLAAVLAKWRILPSGPDTASAMEGETTAFHEG